MALELLAQRLVLFRDRAMPVPLAPLPDRLGEAADPAGRRAALNRLLASPGLPPVMGEAQEVKRTGPLLRLRTTPLLRPLERHQPRLVRVEGQAVLAEPLRQDLHHTPRVRLVLEADHEVVRVADQV